MISAQTWLWMKTGDHRDEGAALAAKFVAEMGQAAGVGDVNVRVARTPQGTPITVITADHEWWREQMRVHPNGWTGASIGAIAQHFGL